MAWQSLGNNTRLTSFLFGGAVLATTVTMLLQQPQTGVGHDLVSFVAPLDGVLGGYSSLYDSFFNDTPPGIHTILFPWIWLFSSHPWSMYALHISLLVLHQALLLGVIRQHSKPSIAFALFAFVSLIAISHDVFGDMLLTTELSGNVLVLAAIWLYVRFNLESSNTRRHLQAQTLGLCLTIFAFWVREVYIYAVVVAIGMIVYEHLKSGRSLPRLFAVASWGSLLGTFPIVALLMLTEGVRPYVFVLEFKRGLYPLPNPLDVVTAPLTVAARFSELVGIPSALLVACILAAGARSSHHRQRIFVSLALVTVGGFAFAWQGKEMSGHYLAALLPVLAFLMITVGQILAQLPTAKGARYLGTLILLLPLPIVLRHSGNPLTDVKTPSTWWSEVGSQVGSSELPTLSTLDALPPCIQRAYGWAAGMSYRLNQVPPCSKYFLPNLIVDAPFHQLQFKLELLRRPPDIVLYSGGSGADLNIEHFENVVMPWQQLLRTCYRQIENSTEFHSRLTTSDLRECMMPIVADQVFANLRTLQSTDRPWQNLLTPPV